MGNYRGERRFRDSRRSEMFPAVCSECGRDCMVPFRPTGNKPVFCSDCFEDRGGQDRDDRGRRDRDRGGQRFRHEDKRMFSAICDNCGAKCEVPFRPTGDKPIYCSDCFESSDRGGPKTSKGDADLKAQLEELNNKVNQILRLLLPDTAKNKKESVQAAKTEKKNKKDEVAQFVVDEEEKVMEKKAAKSMEAKSSSKKVSKKRASAKKTSKKSKNKKVIKKKSSAKTSKK